MTVEISNHTSPPKLFKELLNEGMYIDSFKHGFKELYESEEISPMMTIIYRDDDTDSILGVCIMKNNKGSAYPIDDKHYFSGSIGFFTKPKHRGKGIATALAKIANELAMIGNIKPCFLVSKEAENLVGRIGASYITPKQINSSSPENDNEHTFANWIRDNNKKNRTGRFCDIT